MSSPSEPEGEVDHTFFDSGCEDNLTATDIVTDERDDTVTEERDDTVTEERDDTVTEERDDTVTEERDDTVTEERDDTVTEERDDTVTGERDDTVTGERDDTVTGERDDTVTEERDDTVTEERDDTVTEERDDTVTEERDDTVTDERDDTVTDERDDTVTEERDDTVPDERDDTVPDERDDTVPDERDDTVPDERDDTVPDERDDTVTGERDDTVTDENPLSSRISSCLQSLELNHSETEGDMNVPFSGNDYSSNSRSRLEGKMVMRFPGSRRRKNFSFTNSEVQRIDRDNQRLFCQLSRFAVGSRPGCAPGQIHRRPVDFISHSAINRQRKHQRIEQDNLAFLKRLESVKPAPGMTRAEQLADYQRQLSRLGMCPIYQPTGSYIAPEPRKTKATRPDWTF